MGRINDCVVGPLMISDWFAVKPGVLSIAIMPPPLVTFIVALT
ncbi:hypothetical protein [Vulcanisaeta distributa]|nr:hypothetical protein [Vulcanisaeta distributa]